MSGPQMPPTAPDFLTSVVKYSHESAGHARTVIMPSSQTTGTRSRNEMISVVQRAVSTLRSFFNSYGAGAKGLAAFMSGICFTLKATDEEVGGEIDATGD